MQFLTSFWGFVCIKGHLFPAPHIHFAVAKMIEVRKDILLYHCVAFNGLSCVHLTFILISILTLFSTVWGKVTVHMCLFLSVL